uniref:TIDP3065 n=1 Tax=Arundo donax TaxID=35708 RepID=A0A0A8ZN49_ARUDO
MNELVSVT